MQKIYIVAGEASGDFLGNKILSHLKNINIKFKGVGGALIEDLGIKSLFPISEINMMGFLEIIPHIFKLKKLIKLTIEDIIKFNPDILITIDSPGFTYRVASKIRVLNPKIKLVHVVAPSVWAYKPNRAKKYAKTYDLLLTLLPFEPPYFTKLGLNCTYIGHPILEQKFYKKLDNKASYTTICVTSGSRTGEITRHAPIFIDALNILAKEYNNLKVIFALIRPEHQCLIERYSKQANFKYSFTIDKLKAYSKSDLALAKSGTNTLEIATSKTPMIVAYKVNFLSYLIIRSLIKVKYISLINIISNQPIIPEFIQNDCNPIKISTTLSDFLKNREIGKAQVQQSLKVLEELGLNQQPIPSKKAADLILELGI